MYIIIAAPSMDSLIESVNNNLIEGFQPIGGMSIVIGRNPSSGLQETTMYQSMWKTPVIAVVEPVVEMVVPTPEPIVPAVLTPAPGTLIAPGTSIAPKPAARATKAPIKAKN